MNIVNKDSKNTFTRMCIGEAIIKLLKDTDFDKIRITSVAKCAGVSRITFYKYYESISVIILSYVSRVSPYFESSSLNFSILNNQSPTPYSSSDGTSSSSSVFNATVKSIT